MLSYQVTLSPDWKATMEREMGGEGEVILGFRPEAGQISDSGALAAEVYATELYGAYTMLHLSIEDTVIHIRAERGIDYPLGVVVRFDLEPEMMRFFDPETEAAITREVG